MPRGTVPENLKYIIDLNINTEGLYRFWFGSIKLLFLQYIFLLFKRGILLLGIDFKLNQNQNLFYES